MIALLKLVINYGKLFGFTPAVIKNEAIISKISFLHAIAILISFTVFITFYAIENAAEELVINRIIMYVQSVSNVIGFFVNVIFGWIHKENLRTFLNGLIYLNDRFGSYILPKNTVRFVLLIGLIGSTTVALLEYICEFVIADKSVNIWRYLVAYVCLVFSCVNIAQLLSFQAVIGGFYKAAVKKLQELVTENKFCNSMVKNNQDFILLRDYRKNVYKIDEVCESLGGYYSAQLLVSVAITFVIITTQIFHCCFVESYDAHVASVAIRLCVYFLQVVLLAASCQRIVDARGEIVKRLLNVAEQRGDLLGKETNLLANQMSDFPIAFTAGNLFDVDKSMLLGIMASVVTYVIVLVQFNLGTAGKFYDTAFAYAEVVDKTGVMVDD